MEGTFLPPPAKRPYNNLSSTTMQETNNNNNLTSNKRRLKIQPPIIIPPGHVAFRLLCHTSKVGGIIGKSGSVVKLFRQQTGAKIQIDEQVSDCDEQVILIVALDNPKKKITLKGLNDDEESDEMYELSPAQEALLKVFERVLDVDAEIEGIFPPSSSGVVSCRLLAFTTQIGSVMGKGGKIIEKIRKESGAKIRVLPVEQLPACASSNDEVIQIVGEFGNVQDALFHVTGRLRDNLFPNRVLNGTGGRSYSSSTIPENNPYGRSRQPNSPAMYPPVGHSQNHDRQATLTKSMDHLGLSHSLNHPPSPRPWASQRPSGGNSSSRGITDIGGGLPSHRGGLELGSGSKSAAIVTNTTVEIVVPEHVIGSVYGENGSNLSRLRQISGAKVTVHDPRPGTSEGMVIISGTPDQTQAAQSLLQAFIISGQ